MTAQRTLEFDSYARNRFLEVMANHIGVERGISGNDLAERLRMYPREVRSLVESLRMEGHHICASPHNGYYIAQDEEELLSTCRLLYARAMKSLQQIARMRNVSLPDLKGQLRIPD